MYRVTGQKSEQKEQLLELGLGLNPKGFDISGYQTQKKCGIQGEGEISHLYLENFISDFINTLADEPEKDKRHG